MVSGHRDIVVSDADAKPVLSHIRSCSTHAFHAAVPKGQFGAGCHDGCTAFAHLLVRGFCDFALSHSLCLVAFFLDVKTASASVLRSLSIPSIDSDAVFLERLTQLGLSRAEIADILVYIQSPARFAKFYGTLHNSYFVSYILSFSLLFSDFNPDVMVPKSGTLAGSSIANLIFVIASSVLVDKFELACQAKGLQTEIPVDFDDIGIQGVVSPASLSNDSVCYMDDLCKPVLCPDRQVIDSLNSLVNIANSVCSSHGLNVNYKPGKSEAVIAYSGPGSKDLRHQIHNVSGNAIDIKCSEELIIKLQVSYLISTLARNLHLWPPLPLPSGRDLLPQNLPSKHYVNLCT